MGTVSGVIDIARRDQGFALAFGDWADDAACARPEHAAVDFFPETNQAPERTHRAKAAPALAVCATCPVTLIEHCARHAELIAERRAAEVAAPSTKVLGRNLTEWGLDARRRS